MAGGFQILLTGGGLEISLVGAGDGANLQDVR
jgi:hypothetical protein